MEILVFCLIVALATAVLHLSFNDSVRVALCNAIAFVIEFFTLTQSDRHFYTRSLEIKRKGYKCIAVARDESCELHDFSLVHQ